MNQPCVDKTRSDRDELQDFFAGPTGPTRIKVVSSAAFNPKNNDQLQLLLWLHWAEPCSNGRAYPLDAIKSTTRGQVYPSRQPSWSVQGVTEPTS